MKNKLVLGSILAVGIIAIVICVGLVNGYSVVKPFISVDPVSEKNTGESFAITGTTDLPEGTELLFEVYPSSFNPQTYNPKTGVQTGEFFGATGVLKVTQGSGSKNIWSFDIDPSALHSGEYFVNVSSFSMDEKTGKFSPGRVYGTTTFPLRQPAGETKSADYIQIDPLADKTTGDLLIVSGTTNLPAGTFLMVQIGSSGIGFGADTIVREGSKGVNRYSMPADTSLLKPGTQTITVTQMIGDLAKGDYREGTVKGESAFTLKGAYLGTETPVQATVTEKDYIRINAIGDHAAGDQFLITGTTSLPAGVGLIWQVMPNTGTIPPSGLDLNAKGIMANNPVTKGDGSVNHVSLAIDLTDMEPGEYIVIVGEMKGDPSTRDIRTGELVGSALFNVL